MRRMLDLPSVSHSEQRSQGSSGDLGEEPAKKGPQTESCVLAWKAWCRPVPPVVSCPGFAVPRCGSGEGRGCRGISTSAYLNSSRNFAPWSVGKGVSFY